MNEGGKGAGAVKVEAVPCLADNYSYLVRHAGASFLVDCGDAAPVIERLGPGGRLDAVLLTHYHYDHTDGVRGIKERWPGARVYGPKGEDRIRGVDERVGDGDRIRLGPIEITAMSVPFHTDHCVNYYTGGNLFTSDTLFSAGCGRLFEGTAEELERAMDRIRGLPPETRIYFGHEYTGKNLEFALTVEPENAEIKRYLDECKEIRRRGGATTPTTLDRELRVNPFLRIDEDAVRRFVDPYGRLSRTERLAELRKAKDRF